MRLPWNEALLEFGTSEPETCIIDGARSGAEHEATQRRVQFQPRPIRRSRRIRQDDSYSGADGWAGSKNRGCRWRTPVPDPTALTATEQVDVSAICPVCRAGLIPQLNARTLHGPKADRPEPGMHAKALGRRPSSRALVNSPVHRSWNSAAAWRVVLRKQRSMEVVRRTFGSRFLVRPEYCPGGHAGRTTTFVLTGVRA